MSLFIAGTAACVRSAQTGNAAASLAATSGAGFSQVPGVVVVHSAAATRQFIGSPGLAVLPNGHYLAKCDLFGPGTDDEHSGTTPVFASADRGRTWTHLTDVTGMYWATIFVHEKAVYLLGVDHEYGDIVIRRSDDSGHTWTTPTDAGSGLLRADGQFHCAPVPVVEYKGRLWRAFEQRNPTTGWADHFRAFMMSAPVGADLLRADSWTSSVPLEQDHSWNGGDFGGWLEGNAVVAPSGGIVDILRVAVRKQPDKAAIVHMSSDGRTGTFDPAHDIINFPGGATKFAIRFDPRTRLYWSLTNAIPPAYLGGDPGSTRNTLALISSPDLRTWTTRTLLLSHSDPAKYGFQYVDWQFDGDDIIATSRTAYDDGLGGADSYHNANFLTFHRFTNFRRLSPADSVSVPVPPVVRYETEDFVVTGRGFEIARLINGEKAFSNRDYAWTNLPAGLRGLSYTRTAGGAAAQTTIKAKRDAALRFATALPMMGADTDGWTISTTTLHYTDRGRTTLTVFSRPLKAGEEATIPQGNWTGGLALLDGTPLDVHRRSEVYSALPWHL